MGQSDQGTCDRAAVPPWHIDKTVGIQEFKNDRSLTDDQIDTIVRWVDAGAPKGDPKDMPAAKQWPDEAAWNFASKFGPPDLVIKTPAYTVPAVAMDAWYKPAVETGLTNPAGFARSRFVLQP